MIARAGACTGGEFCVEDNGKIPGRSSSPRERTVGDRILLRHVQIGCSCRHSVHVRVVCVFVFMCLLIPEHVSVLVMQSRF